MNYYPIVLICLFSVAFAACASSKKRKKEDAITEEAMPAPKEAMPLAPGSALVKAEVLGFEESSSGYHCRIKINTVDGYGANTPPLPEGTEMVILVRKELLESSEPAKDAETMLATGNAMSLTLHYQKAPDLPGKKMPSWRAVMLK